MKRIRVIHLVIVLVFLFGPLKSQIADLKPEILNFEPFVWPSETPLDCPFEQSDEFSGIKFMGIKSGYHYGDT